jgi:hypothetical protein
MSHFETTAGATEDRTICRELPWTTIQLCSQVVRGGETAACRTDSGITTSGLRGGRCQVTAVRRVRFPFLRPLVIHSVLNRLGHAEQPAGLRLIDP